MVNKIMTSDEFCKLLGDAGYQEYYQPCSQSTVVAHSRLWAAPEWDERKNKLEPSQVTQFLEVTGLQGCQDVPYFSRKSRWRP